MRSAASPPLRFAAGLVDIAILAGVEVLLHRGLPRRELAASTPSHLQRLLLSGCYFVGAVGFAGRTGGQALVGLRVVDVVTGRRPRWSASLLWWAARQPAQTLILWLSTSSRVQDASMIRGGLEPEVDELRRRLGHDPPRLYEAIMELDRASGVDPWWGSAPLLVAGVAAAYGWTITAGMLLRPDRRALYDRLAGVVLVRD